MMKHRQKKEVIYGLQSTIIENMSKDAIRKVVNKSVHLNKNFGLNDDVIQALEDYCDYAKKKYNLLNEIGYGENISARIIFFIVK